MSKHTPGPWVFEPDMGEHVIRGAEVEHTEEVFPYSFRDYVASTWGGENEANARLIAAAPELLEQLENILRAYGSEHESHSFNQWPEVIKARAVILKATGADE